MVFILLEKLTKKNHFKDANDLICLGVISQHPPKIVAPESLNLLTNSSIISGDKSFLMPKNSFGYKKSFFLLNLLFLDSGAVLRYPFNLKPKGTPKFLISIKFNS